MKFLDAEFVKGFIRMANDGWEQLQLLRRNRTMEKERRLLLY